MKYVINLWFILATLAFYSPQPEHSPITDSAKLFFQGEEKIAKVVQCDRVQFRESGGVGSIGMNRYKVYDYIPVAITSDGDKAFGYHELGKSWCERQVGKSVDVLIHPDDSSRNKISSYIQLWLLPVHILVTMLLIFLTFFRPQYWRYVPETYICGLLVFWVAEYFF